MSKKLGREALLKKIEQTRRLSALASDKLTTERLTEMINELEIQLRQMN